MTNSTYDDHDGMSRAKDAVGTQGLDETAITEVELKQLRVREREAGLVR